MSKFKDCIKTDLDTFINYDEFADIHDIDGKKIKCIFDEDIFKERNISSETRHFEGVFKNVFSIFIKTEDIEKPSISQHMYVDNYLYLVTNVSESDGMYEIELTRNDY